MPADAISVRIRGQEFRVRTDGDEESLPFNHVTQDARCPGQCRVTS